MTHSEPIPVPESRVTISAGTHRGRSGWHVWDVMTAAGRRHVVHIDGGGRVRVSAITTEAAAPSAHA
jgi:hypothetical protein